MALRNHHVSSSPCCLEKILTHPALHESSGSTAAEGRRMGMEEAARPMAFHSSSCTPTQPPTRAFGCLLLCISVCGHRLSSFSVEFSTVIYLDKLASFTLHLYFSEHLPRLRVHCMDFPNHTIGSWQLHMTSEILYTYIWSSEEAIKPYGPLPYSRKHSTSLVAWFIITPRHLAKLTLQLFERSKPAERGRTCTGSCGSADPERLHSAAASWRGEGHTG